MVIAMIKKNHKLYPFVDLVEQLASIKTCLWCVGDAGNELSTPIGSYSFFGQGLSMGSCWVGVTEVEAWEQWPSHCQGSLNGTDAPGATSKLCSTNDWMAGVCHCFEQSEFSARSQDSVRGKAFPPFPRRARGAERTEKGRTMKNLGILGEGDQMSGNCCFLLL